MTDKTFQILDLINRNDYDNGKWGVQQDIEDTLSFFGTIESHSIQGKFLYLYMDEAETLHQWDRNRTPIIPDHIFPLSESLQFLHIYHL